MLPAMQLLDALVPLFHPEEDEPPPVGIAKVLDGGNVSEALLIRRLYESVSAGCVPNRMNIQSPLNEWVGGAPHLPTI